MSHKFLKFVEPLRFLSDFSHAYGFL